MAKHVQRKKFDHPIFAAEVAGAFQQFDPSIPLAKVTAEAFEIDGEYWVYITQEGDWVTGDEPLLPDYELVQ